MPTGSCVCGKIQITTTGEPIAKGLCHCWSCRKLTGSTYTTNIVLPPSALSYTGTPKFYKKTVPTSGNVITNYFCGDCGSPLWGEGGFGENKILRVGVMDGEELEKAKPMLELFSDRRPTWIKEVEGAKSVIGMGESQAVVAEGAGKAEA